MSAACIVIGAIIGVGIFFNPSRTAALTGSGPLVLLAWGLGGVIALLGALVFAELGGMYTDAGAQYQILRDAYGPFPAFLFVFVNATAIQTGAIGVIAVICAENLAVVAGWPPLPPARAYIVASALVAVLTAANIIGVKWGARIQNLTVFAKVATLLIVTALAAALGRHGVLEALPEGVSPNPKTARLGPVAAVAACLVSAMFSYGGWQQILWAGGEVRNPRRAIPRAVVGGVVLVVVVYLLANWAYLRMLGVHAMANAPTLAADAVGAAFDSPDRVSLARRVVAGAVGFSAFGVLNAQFLTGPRLLYGMALDGRFFAFCGRLNPATKTPVGAIVLLPAIALVMLAAAGKDGTDWLVNWSVALDAVFFVLTGLALIVLRRRRPDADRSVRVPLYPLAPLLFALGEVGVVVGACLDDAVQSAAWVGLAWIVGAAVLYAVRFRRADRPGASG